MPNYPREQLLDLYKSLPEELQNAIFSSAAADKMFDICQRNEVKDDNVISEIAKNTGCVMMGVLPPAELQGVFEKEIKLKKDTAKQIVWEISRFILFPVKKYIDALYHTNISAAAPSASAESKTSAKITEGAKVKTEIIVKQARQKKSDGYREPLG